MDFYMQAAHSPSSSSRVKGEGAASLHTTAYRIGLISTYSITNGKTAFKKYAPVCVQPWLNGRVSISSVKKKLYVSDRSATAERKRKIMGCGKQTGRSAGFV